MTVNYKIQNINIVIENKIGIEKENYGIEMLFIVKSYTDTENYWHW